MKRQTADPGLLHEFELPLDIPVQAHEEQSPPLTGLRYIGAADPDDAMTIGDLDLLTRPRMEALAWIGAADMGAERAPQPLRIFGSEQKVVVRLEFRPGVCAGGPSAVWTGSYRDLHRQFLR
jgi:hypothetical protein